MIRPPISYPGAKFKAMDQIIPLIPDGIEDWREPFFGGGSMTLYYMQSHKFSAKKLTVVELSPEVWAFWNGAQLYAQEVIDIIKEWLDKMAPNKSLLSTLDVSDKDYARLEEIVADEGRNFWKWTQTVDTSKMSIAERAARFFIVNKISVSGIGDSSGLVPYKFIEFNYTKANVLKDVQPLLQKIDIIHGSYEELFKNVHPDRTFIIMDPPYWKVGKLPPGKGTNLYGRGGDTHKSFDHELYAQRVKELKCRWLITYDDSVKIRKLYQDKIIRPYKITYTAGDNSNEDALAGEELLIANYDILDEDTLNMPDDF